jgi:hypothetical protein
MLQDCLYFMLFISKVVSVVTLHDHLHVEYLNAGSNIILVVNIAGLHTLPVSECSGQNYSLCYWDSTELFLR